MRDRHPSMGSSFFARFWLDLVPRGKGRPRFGNGRTYTDKRTREAEAEFSRLAAPYAPATPPDGPVRLGLVFLLPIPKSWPKWKRRAADVGWLRHRSKPDVSNLVKLAEDAMEAGGWFLSDSQIVELRASKCYAEEPGVEVTFEAFEKHPRLK